MKLIITQHHMWVRVCLSTSLRLLPPVADAASPWIDCKSHTQPARSSLSCLSPIKQTSLFFYSTSSLKRWFCSHQQHRCPLSGQTLCYGGAQALLSEQPAAGYGGWMMQRNGNEWCKDFLLHGFHLFFILIKINQRWTRFFFCLRSSSAEFVGVVQAVCSGKLTRESWRGHLEALRVLSARFNDD